MTTEEISNRSGASKATIYKWWPNKYAVAVEAFLTEMMAEAPDPDTGSAHEDFRLVIRGLTHFYTGASGQRLRAAGRGGAVRSTGAGGVARRT